MNATKGDDMDLMDLEIEAVRKSYDSIDKHLDSLDDLLKSVTSQYPCVAARLERDRLVMEYLEDGEFEDMLNGRR